MGEPERSSRQRRPLPRSGNLEQKGTILGVGVPVAPSFLELDDEETVAYNARRTPAVSLPALRAECVEEDEPTTVALTDDDLEMLPTTTFDAAPPTPPRFEPRPAIDRPAPQRSVARVSVATKALARTVPSAPRSRHERDVVSSHPPQSHRRARTRRSQPSTLLPKLLFLATLVMVVMVVATEISVRRNLPWLDCRPYLLKAWQFVSQKIPWDRLPKLPRF